MWLLLFISSSSYNKQNLIKHSFSNEVKQFILNDFYVYFSFIVSKKKSAYIKHGLLNEQLN